MRPLFINRRGRHCDVTYQCIHNSFELHIKAGTVNIGAQVYCELANVLQSKLEKRKRNWSLRFANIKHYRLK